MIQQLSQPADTSAETAKLNDLMKVASHLNAKDRAFAESLATQHKAKGYLSEKQWPWVEKLAERAKAAVGKSSTPAPVQKATGAFDAFARAVPGGKIHPKVLIATAAENTVALTPASPHGKNAGSINLFFAEGLTTKKGVWSGILRSDDSLRFGTALTPAQRTEIKGALEAFGADVAGVLAATGKAIGCCANCGRTLTHPNSVAFGIGPVCAGYLGVYDQWLAAAAEEEAR